MNDEIDSNFNAVADFIEQQTGFPRKRVQPSTSLLADVGLDGDDAEQFFLAFSKRFDVTLDQFNLSKHFGGEGLPGFSGFAIPLNLILRLFGRDAHRTSDLHPIRVEELVQAVKLKRWPAPD